MQENTNTNRKLTEPNERINYRKPKKSPNKYVFYGIMPMVNKKRDHDITSVVFLNNNHYLEY